MKTNRNELELAARMIEAVAVTLPVQDSTEAWASLAPRLHETVHRPPLAPPRLRRRSLALRVAAAAAAAFMGVAFASLRATPGSTLYPLRTSLEHTALLLSPDDGDLHLRIANARLGDLLHALRDGPISDAPALARGLIEQRAAAKGSGEDVVELDKQIASTVPRALAGAPRGVALQVRAALGALLPTRRIGESSDASREASEAPTDGTLGSGSGTGSEDQEGTSGDAGERSSDGGEQMSGGGSGEESSGSSQPNTETSGEGSDDLRTTSGGDGDEPLTRE